MDVFESFNIAVTLLCYIDDISYSLLGTILQNTVLYSTFLFSHQQFYEPDVNDNDNCMWSLGL